MNHHGARDRTAREQPARPVVQSWFPPGRPRVRRARLEAVRPTAVDIPVGEERPRVVGVALRPPPIRVRSFTFDSSAADDASGFAPSAAGAGQRAAAPGTRRGSTPIRPPGDVVKLEDRLNYLLQPSIEVLLAERSLDFPCRPFAYQLEGVAFLYPRHAAILADEMGLGKTMQAITAVRLLLRCAEVRRVLLVCPKPLVSNWRREFAQWAPEVPVMVVEGSAARRRWQWRLPDVPVRIANYELLCRDRDLLTGRPGPAVSLHGSIAQDGVPQSDV
ncbi:MAG: SNF2-related protein, partial [Pirellulales bacterium]